MCNSAQGGALMVGIHSLRKTCVGYHSGAHCPNENCALCSVLNYHRDLETLRAQADLMESSSGEYLNIRNFLRGVFLGLKMCRFPLVIYIVSTETLVIYFVVYRISSFLTLF